MSPSFKSAFTVDEKERDKNIAESYEALLILENELKDKFFGGEEIGFVDIAAVGSAILLLPRSSFQSG